MTTNGNETYDRALEAFFELGATLPVEYGTEQYDRLREIASEVGSALVKADSDESTVLRKEVAALVIVSSAVDHFPILVNNPDAADNPDVDRVLIDLIEAGVTDVDSFYEAPDATKFDESDDQIELMLSGLRGVVDKAKEYNQEVKKGMDGIEPVVMDKDSDSDDEDQDNEDYEYMDRAVVEELDEDGPIVEESDSDEIEGSTF